MPEKASFLAQMFLEIWRMNETLMLPLKLLLKSLTLDLIGEVVRD